jgi:uncharacterized protein YbaR (Trm112 family)
LLERLRCPACHSTLALADSAGDWIESGELVCQTAGHHYRIHRGMPYLFVDDEHWQPKAREAAGWVRFHKDR